MNGIMIGAGFEVRYHVRAPKNAVVNVTNTNGQSASPRSTARSPRIRPTAASAARRWPAASTRARPTAACRSTWRRSAPSEISLETTNGGVTLALPDNAKATVSASCTNGGISVGSLDNFEVTEKSRRRLEGKLNGGGTPVDLQTTNGGIRLRSRDRSTRAPTPTPRMQRGKR